MKSSGGIIKILIACEFSGIVREAFNKHGHDAWSCDLLNTEIAGKHLKCDVLTILNDGWDLMIAHPDCKYLAISGLHWNKKIKGREKKTEQAIDFVNKLLNAPIEKIALENPVSCISTRIYQPTQIIQPFQFGHPESKKTCLWLKNLPKLKPTNILPLPACGYWENQTPSGQNKLSPTADRWKKRARTYQGIADAMAEQWG